MKDCFVVPPRKDEPLMIRHCELKQGVSVGVKQSFMKGHLAGTIFPIV